MAEGLDIEEILGALAWEGIVTYFRTSTMDGLPSYRAQGWQIGSGPVEAACKTVIVQRMKGWDAVGP